MDDYSHTLKGEGPCPPETKASLRYQIEAKPATDAVRERTGYSRVVTWVRKDNFMVVKYENFDGTDTLVKTSVLTRIEKLPTGKWLTHEMLVTTKKDGRA